ncbi:MAG TPA: ABC transporter permease [Gemmatimonadales bacterium]|nr:ABC transporter permease [Gemmatimonadales bacterium]
MRDSLRALGTGAAALGAGLLILAGGLHLAGYDAGGALAALWDGAFGSWRVFTGATLLRSVPLILIGLGFALALRGGALNIGAEGQFYAGAIAATWVGVQAGAWPAWVALPAVALAGVAAGALWMLLPVILRLRFGVLEVISTLLLNFVAEALVSYMVQGPMQEPSGIYPQSAPIAAAGRLPFLPGTRLHTGFVVALAVAGVLAFVFARTWWGFRLRALGEGPIAAQISGRVPAARMVALALLGSGALAGLAGAFEVSGVSYALYQNLSPGYGFTAIGVALLARLRPSAIVLTGIVFGALEAGAGAMQRDAGIPAVAVYVVEGAVILVLLLGDAFARRGLRRRAAAVDGSP